MNKISTLHCSLGSILVGAALCLSGCSLPIREHAVPHAWSEKAEVVGLPGVRYVVRAEMLEFVQDALQSLKRERAYPTQKGQGQSLPPANFLALSGAGQQYANRRSLNGDSAASLCANCASSRKIAPGVLAYVMTG